MLWSWTDNLEGPFFSPWIKVKASAMEIDGSLVMVPIPIAAGKPLHFFNLAVEAFPQCIGNPMLGVGYDIIDVRFEALGGLDHRPESRVSGPEIPTREVFSHPPFSVIVPEMAEIVFDGASTTHLEIQ